MNRNYRNIIRRAKTVVLWFAMLGTPFGVMAQLSGTYTLNNASTTSGTNFNNWTDFASAINLNGVSGPVTLNVQSSLTVTNNVAFNQFAGTSNSNRVTINGGGNFISYAGTSTVPQVFLFNGADNITINNLVIRNTGTVVNVQGVRLTNNADNNIINACTIEFTSLVSLGSTSGGAYVALSSSTSLSNFGGALTNGNGANNTVSNCLMRTTNVNSPGPFCGIFEVQSFSNYTTFAYNNSYVGNTIQNFYSYGINTTYTSGSVVSNNDISRFNATSGLPNTFTYPLYAFYVNTINRAIRLDSNKIHDLPFLNAVASTSHTGSWNIGLGLTVGTTTFPMSLRGNEIYNIMVNTSSNLGIYGQSVSFCNIRENRIENLRSNSTSSGLTSGAMQAIYFTGGDNLNVVRNNILRCRPFQTFYGIYMANQNSSFRGVISENVLKDNQSTSQNFTFPWMYGIWANNGAWDVSRNMIDELIQQGPYGYLVPFYATVTGSGIVHNWFGNIATHSIGAYYTWGLYSSVNTGATLNFRQNTMNFNFRNSPYGWSYYSNFHYGFGFGNTNFEGNVMLNNTDFSWGMYYGSNTTTVRYSNNHLWAPNATWTPQFFSPATGNMTDYNSWRTAGFGGQIGDMRRNPRFVDVNNRNLACQDFFTQNNVPTLTNTPVEFNGNARNLIMSDRGAVERFMDIERVRTSLSVPSVVCSGWEQNVAMTVRNLYNDTAYNFNVSYSSNGGPKTSRMVTARLMQNDTSRVTFNFPLRLNAVGATRVAIYVDIPDDNRSNDSFVFTTTVRPAPGGGRYTPSSAATTAFYNSGRPNDVTQIKVPVYFTVNAPRSYSNGTYWNGTGSASGKDWTVSTFAVTKAGGTLLSGTTSISKHASGSNDLEVKFETANSGLEDSMITFVTKITDLNNGCDTFIRRDILIYPTINADFGFPARICDGDLVLFQQKSKVNSGSMEFFWNFGTGLAADTSGAPEPVFQFPKSGTYKVIMTAKTLPYGFPSYDTANVVVNPNPAVKFSKLNACEGNDLVFTNLTTPTTGVNSSWNFGNGVNRADNSTTVRYKYARDGAYTVTLTANLNGCVASTSQRVYQFPKPKANYDLLKGSCDNEQFEFNNKSTISTGSVGAFWNFGDATVSTDDDAVKTYSSSGAKTVKLIATSEFGCKDSMVKTIQVLESPKMAFINTPTCSRTPASFNNTTPTVGGAGGSVKKYSWDFGDGKTSAIENPTHQYTSLGDKTVTFAIELMNGCKSSISKDLKVGIQAKASFSVADICLGKPAVFANNTTWPQGEISYLWNFGDGTTSTSTNPVHTYNKAFSPNITLYASIKGGCTDSLVINTFNIFEGPRTCDFAVNTDYAFGFYGVSVNPLNASTGVTGGQDKVDYTWIFDGGGTNKTSGINAETKYNFQADGVYNVTMRARSTSAPFCECSKTKQVVMNRMSTKNLEETGVALFPNPNNGQFNLMVNETFGKNLTIDITGVSGNLVKRINAVNSGVIAINSGDVANGVYMVRVVSGDHSAVRRIVVNK